MATQTPVQSVLDDPRWDSGIVTDNQSDIQIRLLTFPGVVGGEFKAQVIGLLPQHMGQAEVTISCAGFESSNHSREFRPSNTDICFLEVETFQIQDPSLQVQFLIPFESKGTDEGYAWHLQIQFASGTAAIFEVPVCRTHESNPEVSELEIAAAGLNCKDQWQAERFEQRSPGLAKGIGVFWVLWALVTILFYFIFEGDVEVMVLLGLPLIALSTLLTFALFGVSKIKFSKDQMERRHSLFGLSIPMRVKRSDIAGFNTKCVGSLGDSGGSYLVVAEKTDSSNVFLSAALLNKNDAQTLVKRLNGFWDFRRNY